MKVELRILGGRKKLLLFANKQESKLLDKVFGTTVSDCGHIARVFGTVQLSDGYVGHYIALEKGAKSQDQVKKKNKR